MTKGGQKYDTLPTAVPSLREVVAEWLRSYKYTDELPPWEGEIWYKDVTDLLALLSQHSVVQLDENQELPELPDRWHEHESEGWAELISEGSAKAVIDTLLKDNFKRVRPLVEEKP